MKYSIYDSLNYEKRDSSDSFLSDVLSFKDEIVRVNRRKNPDIDYRIAKRYISKIVSKIKSLFFRRIDDNLCNSILKSAIDIINNAKIHIESLYYCGKVSSIIGMLDRISDFLYSYYTGEDFQLSLFDFQDYLVDNFRQQSKVFCQWINHRFAVRQHLWRVGNMTELERLNNKEKKKIFKLNYKQFILVF